jgi:pimeloyl-ACP methyl ester carboxylesterase
MGAPEPRSPWIDVERHPQVIPFDNGLHLLRVIPGAQLHALGLCGHWTQIERASQFNAFVRGFLASDD